MAYPAEIIPQRFSWNEYKDWPEDERWELIDGEAYNMSAAPNIRHQRITGNFFVALTLHLKGKGCTAFIAPTDVVFDDYNIVQPDVLVVCDPSKITDANIQGAPDLVVEVLSPSNSTREKKLKRALYQRFGVREYLLVDPASDLVERYLLENGVYGRSDVFAWHEELLLAILPELVVPLWEIFERDLAELNVVREGPVRCR
jgi:Uma2 family endonuclease